MALRNENIEQQRSLVNVIAVIGATGTLFILIILLIYFGWPAESNRFLFVGSIFLFLFAILVNKLKRPVLAKYIIAYTPVLFSLAISIVNKRIGPIFINDYYVTRVAILAVSIVPILVFRYNEYNHLVMNLLPSFLVLSFFDPLHNYFDVGIFDTGYTDDTYFMTNYVMIMCYLALNGFIYSIKRKNDKYYEQILSNTKRLVEQNNQLMELNLQVEDKNRIISDQNTQLVEFSQNLKKKVDKRTRELTHLNQELAGQNVKLEQFTFITAHNIKSPVAQIKGLLNLINYENGIPKSALNLIKKIDLSCDNLVEVIGDLNKILNIKNNVHIIERFNIAELIDQIIISLKSEIQEKKVTIQRRYHAIVEINSIKAFIYSILFNLINNAIKFVDPQKTKRDIEIYIELQKEQISIGINDNGLGFDQEMAGEKVFQLYQRFNTNIQGKGLGLFLVKTQIEMLNGEIHIESKEGVGTYVELTIPQNPV